MSAERPEPGLLIDAAGSLWGIVLCGGASSRMGSDKASLTFGGEALLARMVRIVGGVTEQVIVVASPAQRLPPLPKLVRVVHDRQPGRGPLEGLAAGLQAVGDEQAVAFVTSCDAPLLRPAVIERVVSLLGAHDCAAPLINELLQPLTAAYRVSLLPRLEQALADQQLGIWRLLEKLDTRRILPAELTDADPELESFRTCNTPEEYRALLDATPE